MRGWCLDLGLAPCWPFHHPPHRASSWVLRRTHEIMSGKSSELLGEKRPQGPQVGSIMNRCSHLGAPQLPAGQSGNPGLVLGWAWPRRGMDTSQPPGGPVPGRGNKEPLWDFGYSAKRIGVSFPANGKCEGASLTAFPGGAPTECPAGDPLCCQEQRAVGPQA